MGVAVATAGVVVGALTLVMVVTVVFFALFTILLFCRRLEQTTQPTMHPIIPHTATVEKIPPKITAEMEEVVLEPMYMVVANKIENLRPISK